MRLVKDLEIAQLLRNFFSTNPKFKSIILTLILVEIITPSKVDPVRLY